ncbi:glycosyltransferase [Candidatus Saccharibacteria bacterium]|nr:glycosyltransferase [Candidatus Saccharibacteria bacterium]
MSKKETAIKKVAITTWWSHHNHGTALQVTALSNVIKSLGYDVDVVNYIPSNRRYIVNYGGGLSIDWGESERVVDGVRDNRFKAYLDKHLTLTRKCTADKDFEKLNDEYDAFVAGSDQIWSPTVFDPRYFLDYIKNDWEKISYAPSMGPSYVENEYIRSQMRSLIAGIAYLSVREKQGAELIYELTGRRAEVVIDPTLLMSYEDWRKMMPSGGVRGKEKYIFCYFLGESDGVWEHVEAISRQTGWSVKILPIFAKDSCHGDFEMGTGPEEFFNLVDNAEMVLTDSFHGAIFSILCEKPFYVFERFASKNKLSQNTRIYNFLKLTGLERRLIGYGEKAKKKYDLNVELVGAQKAIRREKEKSLAFLRESLERGSPLVSVIVPVYDVERYVKQCLDSISNQTYKNIEIIVVDDGTTDRAGEIADECAKKDGRIRVIHQENGGLSVARNTGYDAAGGEYVVFVDSDDTLAPEYIEYMLRIIESTKTDVAMSENRFDCYQKCQVGEDRVEVVAGDEVLRRIQYDRNQEVWNKIYRKSYLDRVGVRHFPEILFGEGNTFNTYVLQGVDRVGVGQRRVYYYRNNPHSSTRKFAWDKRRQTIAIALERRDKVIRRKGKGLRRAFRYHVWKTAFYVYRGIVSLENREEYKADEKKYRRLLRVGILGPWLADPTEISREYKKWSLRVFVSPERMAEEANREEAMNRLVGGQGDCDGEAGSKNVAGRDELGAQLAYFVKESGREVEVERLAAELAYFSSEIAYRDGKIAKLNEELASHMSIKRAVKLAIGNVKRRIVHGRDRGAK